MEALESLLRMMDELNVIGYPIITYSTDIETADGDGVILTENGVYIDPEYIHTIDFALPVGEDDDEYYGKDNSANIIACFKGREIRINPGDDEYKIDFDELEKVVSKYSPWKLVKNKKKRLA